MLKKQARVLEKGGKLYEKNKNLLESEKQSKEILRSKLNNQGNQKAIKEKYLKEEKNTFIENYYVNFIFNFEDICSFAKEKEIFSLLNSFSE